MIVADIVTVKEQVGCRFLALIEQEERSVSHLALLLCQNNKRRREIERGQRRRKQNNTRNGRELNVNRRQEKIV